MTSAFGFGPTVFTNRIMIEVGAAATVLFTFGLVFIIQRGVQMIWGMLPVPYRVPALLDFPLFSLYGIDFPASPMANALRSACTCVPGGKSAGKG